MTIVTNVPQTNVPGRSAFIDNSQAVQANAGTDYRVLLIGTKVAGATGPVDVVTQIFSGDDGVQWGEGGMLDRDIKLAVAANPSIPMFAIALDEAGGSAKAELNITIPASLTTADAVLHMYVGGLYTPVAIPDASNESAISAAIGAAVDAKTGLTMVELLVLAGVVDLQCKFSGVAGNSINVQFNRGIKEEFPPGMATPVVVSILGTLDPDITPAIAAMVGAQFTHIHLPYEATAQQDEMLAELVTRFGPEDQEWGISFTAKDDTTANLLIYGASRNSQLQVTPEVDIGTASPNFECGAVMVAIAAGEPDPARPLQTLTLPGIVGALEGVGLRRSKSERNALLGSGIATTKVADDGSVQIERFVTNYLKNPAGSPDVSYKDLMTVLVALVFRDAINAHFAGKYPRHKLADDGNDFGANQPVITPNIAKAEIMTVFDVFLEAAILENREQFLADLIVERSNVDKNRLEYSCNPDTVNQFRIFAGVIAFIL